MSKYVSMLTTFLVLISIVGCIQATPLPEAQADYCADLKAYGQEVADVRNLPVDATIEEFEAAMDEVNQAYRELENSAWDLADSQNEALKPAYDQMRSDLDQITDDTPVVEARQIISDSWSTYKDAYQEVVQFSCTAPA